MAVQKKIGVFGGSFNPVHLGHLAAAREAKERLRLDAVWFVPCSRSADGKALWPAARRLALLRAALKGKRGYRVLDSELRRGGISRTVDTLRELTSRHPQKKFWLLLGADQARAFFSWKEPKAILSLSRLAVLARPGFKLPAGLQQKLGATALDIPQYEISSGEIRKRLKSGKDVTWMVPDAVARLI